MNVLITDDENEILDILDFLIHDKFNNKVKTFLAKTSAEAIEILANNPINLCIVDHNLAEDKGYTILNYIIEKKLESKFVLCSTVTPKDVAAQYKIENIYFNIVKPDVFIGIEKLAEKLATISEEETNIIDIYIPISVDFLLFLEKTPADIYIKINETKYLKCFDGNTIFTLAEKQKYHEKSVHTLYCNKGSSQINTQSIITNAVEKIMQRQNLSLTDKMELSHAQLVELIKFTGITPELSNIVKDNILQTANFIMNDSTLNDFWKKINLKGEYPSKLYALHSMLAAVILKKLKWNTEATLFKLTMAAFFQDITLESIALMKLYDYSDFQAQESTFKRHEVKNYLDHPLKANELLSIIKNMPPDIDKFILEQHEMPESNGFPRKIGASKLAPLSCTFILSGILARYILAEGSKFQLQNFVEMFQKRGYDKGNFKDTFDVIRSMNG